MTKLYLYVKKTYFLLVSRPRASGKNTQGENLCLAVRYTQTLHKLAPELHTMMCIIKHWKKSILNVIKFKSYTCGSTGFLTTIQQYHFLPQYHFFTTIPQYNFFTTRPQYHFFTTISFFYHNIIFFTTISFFTTIPLYFFTTISFLYHNTTIQFLYHNIISLPQYHHCTQTNDFRFSLNHWKLIFLFFITMLMEIAVFMVRMCLVGLETSIRSYLE